MDAVNKLLGCGRFGKHLVNARCYYGFTAVHYAVPKMNLVERLLYVVDDLNELERFWFCYWTGNSASYHRLHLQDKAAVNGTDYLKSAGATCFPVFFDFRDNYNASAKTVVTLKNKYPGVLDKQKNKKIVQDQVDKTKESVDVVVSTSFGIQMTSEFEISE